MPFYLDTGLHPNQTTLGNVASVTSGLEGLDGTGLYDTSDPNDVAEADARKAADNAAANQPKAEQPHSYDEVTSVVVPQYEPVAIHNANESTAITTDSNTTVGSVIGDSIQGSIDLAKNGIDRTGREAAAEILIKGNGANLPAPGHGSREVISRIGLPIPVQSQLPKFIGVKT